MAFSLLHQKKPDQNPQDAASKIIAKAQRKSEVLLENAVKEAELIISQTKNFRDELQKSLKEDVAYQASQFAQGYQGLLPEIKKYYQTGIDEQLRAFEDQLRVFTLDVEKTFKDKLDTLANLLRDQTLQEFTIVQKELTDYKQAKMREIDERVKRIVKTAAAEVVGKTLSLADHQDLIMKALEKAKREGVFEK